ncbi:MAG TPA: rhodanese-like domain-containing protein [Vicinamibacterales bacterium]|nr:rhodanese-like domain-containing protein [Vicinamibacterales bacterium]
MFVKRFYEAPIAQASYLIGCQQTGEAILIDANRDVDQYIAAAAREGLRITQVTETHIHADYVSGSRELAQRTGARLSLSDEGDRDWKYQFPHDRKLKNGDRLTVGNITLDVLHTPGHTPEHVTFLVTDGAAADRPIAAVTGDFVFVGDVGRPDLLERAANIKGTMEAGARTLWKSLQAFAKQEDWLQIWPGHGAGSACGKGISAIPSSTLGYEKRFNWAFKTPSESAFVDAVLAGQPEPPTYFAKMKKVNKEGPAILNGFHVPPRLDGDRMAELLARNALVIDTRPAAEYAAKHTPGTVNIPFNASFVTWAGWLVSADEFYLIVDDATAAARLPELARSLALIGLDRISGYFDPSAIRGIAAIPQIEPADLAARLNEVTVVDVRGASEWVAGHIAGARHIPLGYLADRAAEIPKNVPVVVHCQSGARSSIGASVLERLGFSYILNLSGGLTAWAAAGLPVTEGAREQQAAGA